MPFRGTKPRVLVALLGAIAGLLLAAPASASAASADIAALQVAMNALGLYPHPVDGISGPWTQQAVRTFQSRHQLAVDGVAGPQTRAALGKRGKPNLGARPMQEGKRGWDVAALQFLLQRARLRAGRVRRRLRAQHRRARFAVSRRPPALSVSMALPGPATLSRAARARRWSRRRPSARSASSDRSRARSAIGSAGSRPGAGTPASTSRSRWGPRSMPAVSASSPSRASTPAATAISW